MAKIYQNIKAFLASDRMLHVWLSFFITMVISAIFHMMDTADKWQIVILSGVLSFFVGVFVESFDGYFGTKEWEKTGKITNKFDPKDLLFDIIGCVLAILIMLEWFWALGGFN